MPGPASAIDLEKLRAAADQSPTFRAAMIRHGLAVYVQVQQTAGCNASHTVESRLARCLLQTHDLSGGCKLVLTQESMAQMIGARRNSVSLVASTLQQANFIHYSRGHIEITDIEGLKKTRIAPANATPRSSPSTTGCSIRAARRKIRRLVERAELRTHRARMTLRTITARPRFIRPGINALFKDR